jgi:hypothetical protein
VSESWAEHAGQAEIPLAGGDVTEGVVRVGDTVRRPVGPHSPLVHALLTHLESAGFEGAPRFLGVDGSGREVLTYIDGEVAGRPRPPWIADETRLASVGQLVRAYDDAAVSFAPAPDALPGTRAPEPPGIPPAPAYPPELIGHVDITPENVVFRHGGAYALIDFDLAKPATRADEMFNAMLWWAPLSDPRDVDPLLRHADAARRAQTHGGGWQLDPGRRGPQELVSRGHRAAPGPLRPVRESSLAQGRWAESPAWMASLPQLASRCSASAERDPGSAS